MKDKLRALRQKSKSPVAQHFVSTLIGGVAGASIVALYYRNMMPAHRTLVLCEEAYQALINDETNFVRFTSDKSEHAFRVILEQWI